MDTRGQALVEFALVLPILLVVVLGILQFASAYENYLRLTDAVRVAGRMAATQKPDSVTPLMTTTACNTGRDAFETNISTPPASWASCAPQTIEGDPGVKITATYPFSISILGVVVFSGNLSSAATERLL